MAKHHSTPIAVAATEVPTRKTKSIYPEPFASMMSGREKQALGDFFGLSNFGVNRTRLTPGSMSALRHAHSKQDELIFVLEGHPTLYTNDGPIRLSPGMCAGFKAGSGNAANLVNESDVDVVILEIGDRSVGDEAFYPDDDLRAALVNGTWQFTHKNGAPY